MDTRALTPPTLPDTIVIKGRIGTVFSTVALLLSAAGIFVGCQLVAYSARPLPAFAATAILLTSGVMAVMGLTAKPHYSLGGTSYRRSRLTVYVFIDENGPCNEDHPTKPRARWTDARQGLGFTSFGVAFAGNLGLAYAAGWFWI